MRKSAGAMHSDCFILPKLIRSKRIGLVSAFYPLMAAGYVVILPDYAIFVSKIYSIL